MICVTFDFFFGCPPEQRPPVRIQLIQISQISDSFTRRLPLQHKQQILRNAMSSSPCRTGPSFDLEIFGKRSLPASIAHGTTEINNPLSKRLTAGRSMSLKKLNLLHVEIDVCCLPIITFFAGGHEVTPRTRRLVSSGTVVSMVSSGVSTWELSIRVTDGWVAS